MNRLLDSLLVAALTAGATLAAPLSDSLVKAIEKDPAQTQRIIVMMQDAPGARSHIRSLDRDRSLVKRAMQQNAKLSQQGLLNELTQFGFASEEVQSNWLVNALVMNATPEQIKALSDRDDVKQIELSETIQLDPVIQEVTEGKLAQGDDEVSTWGLKRVKALEARSTYSVDGSGVVVGILDTGFDAAHPLLSGKLLKFKDFASSKPDPIDDNGHGSHCAGTIGGSAGGGMEIGMAPGVKFVAGKIFTGAGSTTTDAIMNGMQWVVDPDGQPNTGDEPALVSNSWGGGPGRTVFLEATKAWVELGIAPIFAAGNSGPRAGTVGTPGGFLESYAVGATTVNETIANFSSRGPVTWDGQQHIKPDISAPGKDVTSVKAGGGYWTISGTSMATPHVAGLAALMYQANPDLTIEQLFEAINSTSVERGPEGKDNDFGFGEIDAMAALSIVISGGKIKGSVVDTDGNAVSHAVVTVAETGVQLRLKADGSFAATLPEGVYNLSAKGFGFVEKSSGALNVAAGEETNVQFVMDRAPSGTVSGTLSGAGTQVQGTFQVLDTPLAAIETAEDGSFSFQLPAGTYSGVGNAYGYEVGSSSEFTVVAGQSTEVSLDLAKLPPVLVVDDDKGKNYESFYTSALGASHKVMDYAAISSLLSGSFLGQYEVVVWLTGDDSQATLTAGDQAALGEYLDLGGRLFVSGQDIGYNLKTSAFMADRLGAKYLKDKSGSHAVSGDGLSFSIQGGDGANNQKYPEQIEAAGAGELYMSYDNSTGAATRVASGNSKVVYFGFGFEGIDTAANRKAVMDKVMAYLTPSAEEMALRLEALGTSDEDLALANTLRTLVSTEIEDGAEVASQDRDLKRKALFEALR